jgi:hypothetical protein
MCKHSNLNALVDAQVTLGATMNSTKYCYDVILYTIFEAQTPYNLTKLVLVICLQKLCTSLLPALLPASWA